MYFFSAGDINGAGITDIIGQLLNGHEKETPPLYP